MKMNKYKILFFIVIAFASFSIGFAQPYRIIGDCMEPALKDGKRYFLNRFLPYLRNYQKGDIILFKHDGKVWVSRIAALENSLFQFNDKSFQIPDGYVFVLSDNLSAQHDDSRVFGPISKKSIIGLLW